MPNNLVISENFLTFLADNQPLPDDSELGELVKTLDEARKWFKKNYDERCVDLFLGCFGTGDGFGVYQMIEDTITAYPPEIVVPLLRKHLESQYFGVRYWNSQIAQLFPDGILLLPLANLLNEGDVDTRFSCAMAISLIKSQNSVSILRKHLSSEKDSDIYDFVQRFLVEFSKESPND